jgi:DNA-binding NarL/FixJ family response regulator
MCVDDHRIVLDGIALIVGRQPDMEVVGCATSGEEAVALFRLRRPDVTLMDLQLGGMSGLEAIRVIRREDPEARVIVLTMYQGDEDIAKAIEAGAVTYLVKGMMSDDLTQTVRDVHAGTCRLPQAVEAQLAVRARENTLTRREVQVIDLISTGMRNKEVAAALDVSEETVQVHVKNIFTKLTVNDRTAAVNVALRRGIIHYS